MIKNILFDFAGVIMNLNIERDTRSLTAAGLPDWQGCQQNTTLRDILIDYLNGLMTWKDFLPVIRPFCKPEVTDQEIYNAMNDVLDDVPASRVDYILSLRKHYNVYLLSNISYESWLICKERFEACGHTLDECFDQVFLSYEMKLAKPDERIYREVVKKTGINPDETVYLDDTHENVVAGNSIGMHSYQVEMNNIEKTLEALQLNK